MLCQLITHDGLCSCQSWFMPFWERGHVSCCLTQQWQGFVYKAMACGISLLQSGFVNGDVYVKLETIPSNKHV